GQQVSSGDWPHQAEGRVRLSGNIMADATIRRAISLVGFPAWVGAVVLTLLTAGCATVEREPRPPVFYPPLPNPPRIQYLATFSQARDAGDKPSGFAEFVLGKETPDSDSVRKPYGVAIHEGKILVADTRGNGYAQFDLVAKRFDFILGRGGGAMQKPINITVDRDGTRYVTDTGRNQILSFDRNNKFLKAYGVKDQFKPSDVAVSDNRLYVVDLQHHQIHVLDKASGKTMGKLGKAGSKDGELFQPTNIALGPDNHLYVTDTGNFRVQKLTLDGQFVASYGSIGSGIGKFARPKGVALDRDGRLYVVDAAFENVQVFDRDGKLLMFFGAPGEAPESINLPTVVTIDYDNVRLFQKYAEPKFQLEYVILVASQFGANKVNAYGFGRMEGIDYSVVDRAAERTR
ncbi:MAG: hypothetical protein JSW09_07480, partial [Pseudomonadota bacterium]